MRLLLIWHLHATIEHLLSILWIFVESHIIGWVCLERLSQLWGQLLIYCISSDIRVLSQCLLRLLWNEDLIESIYVLYYLGLSFAHLNWERMIVQTPISHASLKASVSNFTYITSEATARYRLLILTLTDWLQEPIAAFIDEHIRYQALNWS